MGAELDERTIAAEADLLDRCVSFTKGCYTGQELVARLDARGNRVARHLRGLVGGGARRLGGAAGSTRARGRLAPGSEILVRGQGRRHGDVLGVVAERSDARWRWATCTGR